MIKIKESGFFLKSNWLLISLYVLLLSVFIILFMIFISFNYKIDALSNQISGSYEGKKLYGLIDSLQEPEVFESFNKKADSISRLSSFYEGLKKETSFTYLPVADQPLGIEDFEARNMLASTNEEQSYTFEIAGKERTFYSVQALQLNQAVFNFYGLQLAEGTVPSWSTVMYEKKRIPLLLGYQYRSAYQIGDRLSGEFLAELFEFEVVGFLKKNSFIYYQNEAEFYLDEFMLIPYPAALPSEAFQEQFLNRLYFNMLYANIAVEQSLPVERLLETLNKIGKKAGFSEYRILGMNDFVTRYADMQLILHKNWRILLILFVFLLISLTIILLFLAYTLFKRRSIVYEAYRLNGYSRSFIQSMAFSELSIPLFLAFLLYTAILLWYRLADIFRFMIPLGLTGMIAVLTYIVVIQGFLKKLLAHPFRRNA